MCARNRSDQTRAGFDAAAVVNPRLSAKTVHDWPVVKFPPLELEEMVGPRSSRSFQEFYRRVSKASETDLRKIRPRTACL